MPHLFYETIVAKLLGKVSRPIWKKTNSNLRLQVLQLDGKNNQNRRRIRGVENSKKNTSSYIISHETGAKYP